MKGVYKNFLLKSKACEKISGQHTLTVNEYRNVIKLHEGTMCKFSKKQYKCNQMIKFTGSAYHAFLLSYSPFCKTTALFPTTQRPSYIVIS